MYNVYIYISLSEVSPEYLDKTWDIRDKNSLQEILKLIDLVTNVDPSSLWKLVDNSSLGWPSNDMVPGFMQTYLNESMHVS